MRDWRKKGVLLGSIGLILVLYFLAWDVFLMGRPFQRALAPALGKGCAWLGICAAALAVGARFPVPSPLKLRPLLVNIATLLACLLAGLEAEAGLSELLGGGSSYGGGEPSPALTLRVLARDHFPSAILILLTLAFAQQYALAGFRVRQRELDNARMEVSLVRARHQALMNRLQPHFLFNALNSVFALIRTRPEEAERMVIQLGDLLRIALDQASSPLIRLDEEIRIVRTYLDIERTRLQDRLRTRLDVPEALQKVLVPQFLLQPLVENSLKHGIGPLARGGSLEISAWRERNDILIAVDDDGLGCQGHQEGVGLASTRARLALLFPGRGGLEVAPRAGGGTRALVRIPLD